MTGKFNVLFAGNMGKAQALESVLETANLLALREPSIQFVFIGGGIEAENLKKKAAEMNLPNVRFLPPRPPSQIGPVLNLADVLLVHLRNDPLFRITIPSKIQSYMAAGKPILAAVPGDAADLVSRAGAGLSCPSEDPEELARTVLAFYQMPQETLQKIGNQGRDYCFKELSLEAGSSRFEKLFEQVVAKGQGVSGADCRRTLLDKSRNSG